MNGVSICFWNLHHSGREYWKGPVVTHHVTLSVLQSLTELHVPFPSAIIILVVLAASI